MVPYTPRGRLLAGGVYPWNRLRLWIAGETAATSDVEFESMSDSYLAEAGSWIQISLELLRTYA